MNLKQFAIAFQKLLVEASKINEVEDIGVTADAVLEADWEVTITDDMLPDNASEG